MSSDPIFLENLETHINSLSQKLIFLIGKGGVGRSTLADKLATHFASRKENVLVVQWTLSDSLSPRYQLPPCKHKASFLPAGYWTMNYSSQEAIREYFLDHLKYRWLYTLLIENKHVQKLIQTAPGVEELFFLGRLFWLCELANQEQNIVYDRIIVDAPAMGHGISLFQTAQVMANLGVSGPLAKECDRVSKLLKNPEKTSVFFITIAEELSTSEMIEFIPKLQKQIGYKPQGIIVNQALDTNYLPLKPNDLDSLFKTNSSLNAWNTLLSFLDKRLHYMEKITLWGKEQNIPVFYHPDTQFQNTNLSETTTPKAPHEST